MIDYYLDTMESIILDQDNNLNADLVNALMGLIDAVREEVDYIDD